MSSISTTIKSIQKIMRKDTGVDGDAQRISQLVWMIFLKIFDAKESEWEILDDNYVPIIPQNLRWSEWAENDEGITGDELIDFINNKLFKGLKNIKIKSKSDIKPLIVRSVFEDSHNYMKSGTLLRQVINKLNEINFDTQTDRHLFNDIYETILKDLQSAGNAGEYYTPRAVTQFMVDMVDPQLGETVLDFACGTGGFLVGTVEHLKKQQHNVEDILTLQNTIMGVEKKQLPFSLCMTNLILHDFDEPNIKHGNLLTTKLADIKPKDQVDIILTNPPFGGDEEDGIDINFPQKYRTKETADLFMALLMHKLKDNGRAAIVLPDSFLTGESVKTTIKQELLDNFKLHTIVRLPNGVFAPYSDINVNLLFFEKGSQTTDIWYFEHPLPEGYKKYTMTKPIQLCEFDQERAWWNNREENEYAWKVSVQEIKKRGYNMDVKNPIREEEEKLLSPLETLIKIEKSISKSQELIEMIKGGLENDRME